jgi:hypothetical protein
VRPQAADELEDIFFEHLERQISGVVVKLCVRRLLFRAESLVRVPVICSSGDRVVKTGA